MKVITIVGSLREKSYNKMLLHAVKNIAPEEMEIDTCEIGTIPLFNEDLEGSPPNSVVELKNKIKSADAVLFITPEYNYSIPGVLKNAIDWASRPYGDNSFQDKPVGIMGASSSTLGTARAQYHLRQIFVFLDMHPLNKPEVMVNFAGDKFNDAGELIDEHTKEIIKEFLEKFKLWINRIKG